MKYLFLIIRHMFPRKHWKKVGETVVHESGHELPTAVIITLQDQFGNLKTFKVKN